MWKAVKNSRYNSTKSCNPFVLIYKSVTILHDTYKIIFNITAFWPSVPFWNCFYEKLFSLLQLPFYGSRISLSQCIFEETEQLVHIESMQKRFAEFFNISACCLNWWNRINFRWLLTLQFSFPTLNSPRKLKFPWLEKCKLILLLIDSRGSLVNLWKNC